MKKLKFLFIFLFVVFVSESNAKVKLASPFKNHMVLQQNSFVTIWGWANPEEKINLNFGKGNYNVTADTIGNWKIVLNSFKAGGPYTLVVKGENEIIIEDVYFGEVWLCSGQSNMDMTVAREDRYWCGVLNEVEEVKNANYPFIRVFDVPFITKDEPQYTVEGIWEIVSPETVGHLSAAAYFFARELYNKYKVPIGLITSAYGASTAEAWTSRPALERNKEFQFLFENYLEKCAKYDTNDGAKIKYAIAMEKWKSESEKAKAEGKDIPREPKDPNPRHDQHMPCVLYNGMIAPLVPYTIRGAIWYQGESNYPTANIYDKLMETLIYDWREAWKQGDFPFIYVQLANHQNLIEVPVKDDPMVLVREKQLKNLSVRNTAMVVAIDNNSPEDPGNIHPKNKQEIGKRLAIAAMGKVYNEPITFMGPIFNYMQISGNEAILHFENVGEGLVCKGEKLNGFAIANENKEFVWANAKIIDDKIIVSNPEIENPLYVRYGWSKNPPVNIYNKEGLPASPFRTDDF